MENWENNSPDGQIPVGRLERLEREIKKMLEESRDFYYTEYLQKLNGRVHNERYQIDLLQDEFDRCYRLYLQRNPQVNNSVNENTAQLPERAQEAPGSADNSRGPEAEDNDGAAVGAHAEGASVSIDSQVQALGEDGGAAAGLSSEGMSAGVDSQAPTLGEDDHAAEGASAGLDSQVQPVGESGGAAAGVSAQGVFSGADSRALQPGESDGACVGTQDTGNCDGTYARMGAADTVDGGAQGFSTEQEQTKTEAPAGKKNVEFTVGVIVFSIVGAAFILTAFVMLGMTFMNGFVRGMSLYAVSLILFLTAELLVCRRNVKLGRALSSIGAGGLYLSTVLNYITLHNFNGVTAVAVTAVITAGLLFWSRRKDSGLLRVIGIVACYLCFLPLQGTSDAVFPVVTVILFFLNLLCAFLPVGKYRIPLGITQLCANTVFTLLFFLRVGSRADWSWLTAFLLSSLVITELIFHQLLRESGKLHAQGASQSIAGSVTAWSVCAAVYLGMFAMLCLFLIPGWAAHILVAASAAVCLVFFFLQRRRRIKWLQYYFANIIALTVYVLVGRTSDIMICIFCILALAKIISLFKDPVLRVSELVITVIACAGTLILYDSPYAYLTAGGLALSVLFLHDWQAVYAILITLTMAALAGLKLYLPLAPPAVAGVLFVGLLLFNNIDRWRGKGMAAFNYIVLFAMGVLCFPLMLTIPYEGTFLTKLMMLVFGLATIILTFREKYEMDFRHKHLILAGFLTYMVLACRLGLPVLTSILLMLIALVCVGAGFWMKERGVRIYGLVLSLFVCGKVALYDFVGAPDLEKMLLFFGVGVIALTISGIYIVLEKKAQ